MDKFGQKCAKFDKVGRNLIKIYDKIQENLTKIKKI